MIANPVGIFAENAINSNIQVKKSFYYKQTYENLKEKFSFLPV